MLSADFARMPPGRRRRSSAGGQDNFIAWKILAVGRTDAGRPKLPLPKEVFA
jgi:hypothetical protein